MCCAQNFRDYIFLVPVFLSLRPMFCGGQVVIRRGGGFTGFVGLPRGVGEVLVLIPYFDCDVCDVCKEGLEVLDLTPAVHLYTKDLVWTRAGVNRILPSIVPYGRFRVLIVTPGHSNR